MKILQISSGYDISYNGGITNYVRNISSTLQDSGHEVYVLYSQDNGSKKDYNFELIDIKPQLQPFHLSSVITNSDINIIESILRGLKPDIVHVHMMIDLPVKILEIILKYSKLVISLHDYSYICNRIILLDRLGNNCLDSNENIKCNSCISFEETIHNKILGGTLRKFAKFSKQNKLFNSFNHHERFKNGQKLFEKAHAVIAVSSRVKKIYEINNYKNQNFKVNHIGNYTAEDSFRNNFLNREPIESINRIKFGFIGNLTVHKGANVFLRLIDCTKHDFHIYGGIDQEILNKIEGRSNVFYHGKYKHEDLISILKNIDFGLVLSVWEDNAPQVVFEFLNANLPILGTRMGGIPDFINDSNGKLFDITDEGVQEFVNFINSDEVFQVYNNSINHIAGTKKAEKHMEELINIYKSL